jgi:hypothetical protein
MTTQRELKKYRKLLRAFYLKKIGGKEAWVAKIHGGSRQALHQQMQQLDKNPQKVAFLDKFIEATEGERPQLFLKDIRNPTTLKSIIEKLKKL